MRPNADVSPLPAPPPTFRASAEVFADFVARLDFASLPALRDNARRALVVVSPWCSSPLPWFALTTAYLLRRQGVNVALLLNDVCDVEDAATFADELRAINGCLPRFPFFEVIRLSQQPPLPLTDSGRRRLAATARSNAIWQNRGSLPVDRVAALEQRIAAVLSRSLPLIDGLFACRRFDFSVAPGGMYGNSGLLMEAGLERGIRMSTYDSGPTVLLLGLRDAAARCPDIADCVRQASEFLGPDLEPVRQRGRERLHARMTATEKFFTEALFAGQAVQTISIEQDVSTHGDEVVIPLNVEWDTAAVGLHRFFRDDCQWLLETVGFLLERTDARVAVRQHPSGRTVTDGAGALEDELRRHFGSHSRFRFIRATDRVNTYKLLAAARVVLPFTSTIGIEAAMLGKPIILESLAPYAALSFAEVATDRASYFERIAAAVQRPRTLRPEQIDEAALCYFFSAVCNLIETSFTPQPTDFAGWSRLSVDALAGEAGVTLLLQSLIHDIPAAALRARQLVAAAPIFG